MTTNTEQLLRAAELALEALTCAGSVAEGESLERCAIEALRAALTQPAQAGEAVAYLHDDGFWTAAKTDAGRQLNDRLLFAGSPKIGVHTTPPASQEQAAQAWDEGYHQGVADERTSEANIGVAGFGAKVEPARQNPYRTTSSTRQEQAKWTDADSDAARLALELECLLLDTKDTAVVSRWWSSALEALELHRARTNASQEQAARYLIRARWPDGIEQYLDVNNVTDLGGKIGIDVDVPMVHPLTASQEQAQQPSGGEVWIQPNHLQKARVAPFLCRVSPTQDAPDFVPLTAPPAQKEPT